MKPVVLTKSLQKLNYKKKQKKNPQKTTHTPILASQLIFTIEDKYETWTLRNNTLIIYIYHITEFILEFYVFIFIPFHVLNVYELFPLSGVHNHTYEV